MKMENLKILNEILVEVVSCLWDRRFSLNGTSKNCSYDGFSFYCASPSVL